MRQVSVFVGFAVAALALASCINADGAVGSKKWASAAAIERGSNHNSRLTTPLSPALKVRSLNYDEILF
jgi:hypothetical protein